MNVDWEGAGRAWPMPYTAHWTSAASASQQAQIIEGQWVYDGNGIRPAATGFDRLVTLGSMSWTDYDVTATITFNSFDLSKPALGSAAGLALGWQGHSDWGQPHFGHPSGGLCFYDSDGQDPGLFKLLLAYSPRAGSRHRAGEVVHGHPTRRPVQVAIPRAADHRRVDEVQLQDLAGRRHRARRLDAADGHRGLGRSRGDTAGLGECIVAHKY